MTIIQLRIVRTMTRERLKRYRKEGELVNKYKLAALVRIIAGHVIRHNVVRFNVG